MLFFISMILCKSMDIQYCKEELVAQLHRNKYQCTYEEKAIVRSGGKGSAHCLLDIIVLLKIR